MGRCPRPAAVSQVVDVAFLSSVPHKAVSAAVIATASPALVLVDDEKAYTDVLSETLSALLEAPIVVFSRPEAALQALPQLEVAMIVTDYFMPQMNGLDFLRRALQLKPSIPCLMITGHTDALGEAGLPELPELKQVLAKPFPTRQLADAVQRYWPAERTGS